MRARTAQRPPAPEQAKWGLDCPWRISPFTITGTANRTARQTAQNRHREWLHRPERSALRARARRELRGLRLGCWCEQPGPCHGHNLCEVADADIDDDADDTALKGQPLTAL